MPYGEMRFDDEEYLDQSVCEFCGKADGHEPFCVMVEDYEIDTETSDENQHQ